MLVLKFCLSSLFIYLKHICTRNQPQLENEPQIDQYNDKKSQVVGCNNNFMVDEQSEIVLIHLLLCKDLKILTFVNLYSFI